MDVCHASATALARAIRSKQVSSEEVVSAHLARIREVNPRLNAVVYLAAGRAITEAREADAALSRGTVHGPLHGVPITCKDSLDTQGVRSTGGTRGRATFVPAEDATAVARMRRAGAILLGKTNTPELTFTYEADNSVYGRTNNPWDVSRTCGGSSGGGAAIVAAGGSPIDIGSDTGGSVRVPPHYCGVAGLKPTSGRVSRTGHILPPGGALDSLTQIGPMARYVDDLGLVLSVIAGEDFRDPAVIPMPLGVPGDIALRALRVAMYTDNGIVPPTRETVEAVRAAAAALADAGMAVIEARPAGIEQTFNIFSDLFSNDGGATVRSWLDGYGTTEAERSPAMAAVLAAISANPMSAAQFHGVMAGWGTLRTAMLTFMEAYDVILCPVSASPALPHGGSHSLGALAGYSYAQTYNLTGWPAVVVRAGTSPEGLPIGVQVVARPWREDVALAVARHIEAALGGWKAPPEVQ